MSAGAQLTSRPSADWDKLARVTVPRGSRCQVGTDPHGRRAREELPATLTRDSSLRTGRQAQLQEKKGDASLKARPKISTTITYEAAGEVSPLRWGRLKRGPTGRSKFPGTCEACDQHGKCRPVKMADVSVARYGGSGEAHAWDDVTGNEQDPKLTAKAKQ